MFQEQLAVTDAIIHFTVKGKHRLNPNKSLGEAFLCFKDIEKLFEKPRRSMKLFNLVLSQNSDGKIDLLRVDICIL
jgi:hypothetical protein